MIDGLKLGVIFVLVSEAQGERYQILNLSVGTESLCRRD